MHKTMEEINKICEAKKQLMCWVQEELNCGKEYMSKDGVVECVGQLVDMVKDLAEAEEKIMKTKYYEMMVCAAMTTGEDMMDVGRMGYDNWRYKSGKFAPKGSGSNVGHGRGLRMGFVDDRDYPWPDYVDPYMSPDMQYGMQNMGPLGYDRDGNVKWVGRNKERTPDRRSVGPMGFPMDEVWKYGEDWSGMKGTPYEDYRMAKKHYTETNKPEHRKELDDKIVDASVDMIGSMGEMWEDASPETRKKMEENMRTLIRQWEKK